jgi:hypothetical protein
MTDLSGGKISEFMIMFLITLLFYSFMGMYKFLQIASSSKCKKDNKDCMDNNRFSFVGSILRYRLCFVVNLHGFSQVNSHSRLLIDSQALYRTVRIY